MRISVRLDEQQARELDYLKSLFRLFAYSLFCLFWTPINSPPIYGCPIVTIIVTIVSRERRNGR